MKMEKRTNGQFKRNGIRYTRNQLLWALLNHRDHPTISGKNNPLYKNGKAEEYARIRINGKKVKRSHIVWMLWNNKDHIPIGYDIHHKNENKRDDRICNLEIKNSIEQGIKNLRRGNKTLTQLKSERGLSKNGFNKNVQAG